MKLITMLIMLFTGSITFAEITDIKITSFVRLGSQTISAPMLAEICGHVDGDLPAIVTITADPNAKPGNYTTLSDAKGNYCETIATYQGRASVTASSLHDNKLTPSPIIDVNLGKTHR